MQPALCSLFICHVIANRKLHYLSIYKSFEHEQPVQFGRAFLSLNQQNQVYEYRLFSLVLNGKREE